MGGPDSHGSTPARAPPPPSGSSSPRRAGGRVLRPASFPASSRALWDRTAAGPPLCVPALGPFARVSVVMAQGDLAALRARALAGECDVPVAGSFEEGEGGALLLRAGGATKDTAAVVVRASPAAASGAASASEMRVPEDVYREAAGAVLAALEARRGAASVAAYARVRAVCVAHAATPSVAVRGAAVFPRVPLTLRPLRPLGVAATPLARSLAASGLAAGRRRGGFLTLDASRRLVPMLDTDPEAYARPLVGIWTAGQASATHAEVWAQCVRYLFCADIAERVSVAPLTFLVLAYGRASPAPALYECAARLDGPVLARVEFGGDILLDDGDRGEAGTSHQFPCRPAACPRDGVSFARAVSDALREHRAAGGAEVSPDPLPARPRAAPAPVQLAAKPPGPEEERPPPAARDRRSGTVPAMAAAPDDIRRLWEEHERWSRREEGESKHGGAEEEETPAEATTTAPSDTASDGNDPAPTASPAGRRSPKRAVAPRASERRREVEIEDEREEVEAALPADLILRVPSGEHGGAPRAVQTMAESEDGPPLMSAAPPPSSSSSSTTAAQDYPRIAALPESALREERPVPEDELPPDERIAMRYLGRDEWLRLQGAEEDSQ